MYCLFNYLFPIVIYLLLYKALDILNIGMWWLKFCKTSYGIELETTDLIYYFYELKKNLIILYFNNNNITKV